jgi:gliding motility-associated-like protein
VIPGIDLKFDYTKINDCYSRPVINVKNLTASEETVFFDFGDGTTSDLEEDQHYYAQDGVYRVKLVGLKESCVYEKFVDLPFYDLRVPNVITPGSPGFNDTFKIGYGSGIVSSTSLKTSVRIFNRWGSKVFESDDYKDNWAGEGVASGVYYYELEVEGEAVCKGWVHVIK